MSLLSRIFHRRDPREGMLPLYEAIVAEGRREHWYLQGGVPDTLDGRFDMIAAILSQVLLRLEREPDRKQESVWLTETFVDDMDGQLRQIGIGDVVVGKHIGKMMSALGGRITAYRTAMAPDGALSDALVRNLYRGNAPQQAELDYVTGALRRFHDALDSVPAAAVVAGRIQP